MTREQANTADIKKSVKFNLSDGFIEIKEDNLVIHDKAKKDKLLFLLSTLGTILLSLSMIYKWTKTDDKYYLIIGLILLIPNLALLWKWYKEFTFIKNSIELRDIIYFKLVNIKFSDNKVGLFKTNEKTFRRVKISQNDIGLLSDYLASKQIKILT